MKIPAWMSRLKRAPKPIVLGPRNRIQMPGNLARRVPNPVNPFRPVFRPQAPKRIRIPQNKQKVVSKLFPNPILPKVVPVLKKPTFTPISGPLRSVNAQNLPNQGTDPLLQVLQRFQVHFVMRDNKPVQLGSGSYNTVYRVVDTQGKQYALRYSQPSSVPQLFESTKSELALSIDMSNKGIGPKIYRASIFKLNTSNRSFKFVSAMLMDLMDSDLDYVLREMPQHINYDTLAKSLIKGIRALAREGYMCGDIKPENILVKGSKAYMADFDTKFCGKDSFLAKACESVQVIGNQCKVTPSAWKDIREIYFRAMLLLLSEYTETFRKHYPGYRHTSFINRIWNEFERGYRGSSNAKRIIYLGGKPVNVMTILRYSIPGFLMYNEQSRVYRKFNLQNQSKHYHKRNIFRGAMFQHLFEPFL